MAGIYEQLINVETDRLSTISKAPNTHTVKEAQEYDYNVILVYFWLNSVDLAKERVKVRVSKGGHNIPIETIERRYKLGLENLFILFIPIVDSWMIFDTSSNDSNLISEGGRDEENKVYDKEIWETLNSLAYGK